MANAERACLVKITRRKGSFLKQFAGPGESSIACFRFHQAVVASGCPGACSYCFLQTQAPYRDDLYDLRGTLFENLPEMAGEVDDWLKKPQPAGLIVGENQDGLAFERPYKKLLGVTPLEILVPRFTNANPAGHTLIVLSKFTTTEYAEACGVTPHVVFSWSLSLPSISRQYEQHVAPLEKRLACAERLKAAGWRIRFRLDALAPIPGWEDDLAAIMEHINQIGPELLTIGALRATNATALRASAAQNGRDASIFDYLRDKDPSGFKYRVEPQAHQAMFRRVKELLDPTIPFGLCKEDMSLWHTLGLPWQGCHCLHGPSDVVVRERRHLFPLTQVGQQQAPASASIGQPSLFGEAEGASYVC
jgi:hypothetical protein